MKSFIIGIVLPLVVWCGVIYMRASWPYDVHPWQWQWILWVVSMSAGAFLAGIGFRDYWWQRRGKRQHFDHDHVQLDADKSAPPRNRTEM